MPEHVANEPIAIIGSGCRFPGGATSPSKLWDFLREPRDVLSEIPPSRFDVRGFYHPDSQFPGHANVKHAYLLADDVAQFDAQFFNITAPEAVAMDPQQRLLLETVYEGLEGAGLTIEGLRGSNTGVYVGLMYVDYESVQFRDVQHIPTYCAIGTARSIVSNRVSYFFDWHGPSMTIDTACSSSLVALNQAVQALRSGEIRVALAAGTNLLLGPEPFIHESKLKMLSPDGRSRMWDQGANGYARGDGVAAVVLKTLSAALADGDHIEAVIRETGVNQDGRSRGITMPTAAAQAALIRETYARAGLDPAAKADRCQYFEAHGTGTPAGDPVEAEAVHTAFFGNARAEDETEPLFVGSIKTIIGHTESTAGLAGILKVVQAMKHGYVPPNMLLEKLNPDILPFYNHLRIPQELMPWPELPPGQSRRASVNSFGFGGTNAHVIIESFEQPAQQHSDGDSAEVAPFLFSAQSKQSLLASLAAHAQYLSQHPTTSPGDLAWTLRARRSRLPLRIALPASSIDALRSSLAELTSTGTLQLASKSAATNTRSTRLLGIFTGQGAQWARMGAELVERSEYAAGLLAAMDDTLAQLPEQDRPPWTLRAQLLASGAASEVGSAAVSQPLCTAVQVILVELLRRSGVRFAAVVGHSSGEIAAAFAAGFLSAADAIRIAYYRGLHSRLAGGPDGVEGAMLAVGTSLEDAQELCDDDEFKGRVKVAACNSSASVTLSGDEDAITEISEIFEDENKFVRRLKVDKAYHSHHMTSCAQSYLDSMKPFYPAGTPDRGASRQTIWVSSVHPDRAVDEAAGVNASYWVDNLLSPVLFMQATEKAMELPGGPFDAVIEVGPHPALKGPVLDTLRNLQVDNMPYTHMLQRNSNAIHSVSSAIGYLWTYTDNLEIDWDGYESAMGGSASRNRFVLGLPTYQWNHSQEGYWHESQLSRNLRLRSQVVHPLLGDLQPQSSSQQLSWKAILRPSDLPWVHHHRIQGQTVFPAAAYAVTAIETAPFLAKEKASVQMVQLDDLVIHQALVFGNDDQQAGIEVRSMVSNISRLDDSGRISAYFTYEALTGPKQDFHLVASCQISVLVGGDPSTRKTTLPATTCLDPYMADVETELAYSSLMKVGYGYTGPFKALSGLKRKLGKASGLLALTGDDDGLMIHPAVLDAAFHSIILAFSYPEDGGLWTLHLPTRIDRIRLDPSRCGQHWADTESVPFVASMLTTSESRGAAAGFGFKGDVEIHDAISTSGDAHTAVQVEGMHVVPFTPASAADDQPAFYAAHWVNAEPHADEDLAAYRATAEERALAIVNERGSYFYLRKLLEAIPLDHPGRADKFHAAYLNFAEHTHKLVLAGKHRYLKKEWVNDTLEDVVRMSEPFKDKPEIKTMHVVGEHMPRTIRGETNMLEHLMHNGLLAEYYAEGAIVIRGAQVMAETAVQIARRYPNARFLEVGAGTGGATREILKRIGEDFSTYAFTDISAAFFDTAQEEFAPLTGDRMTYSVLDLEQDLATQGFEEGSYDVVVASLVLHATESLEKTVRRVRTLLKPGGYLVLYEVTNVDMIRGTALFGCLPGWWAGIGEGRTLGAGVSDAKWDAVLRKTGFSGVDTITPVQDALEFPNSVIVSQALDDWVEMIREPLLASPSLFTADSAIKHLYIVGGTTFRVSRLAEDTQKAIRGFCDDITRMDSLEDLLDAEVDTDAVVLVLEDLDHPVFKDTTVACWEGLKKLFGSEKTIVWVTQNRLVDNPFGNMAVGFARSALWEHAEMRCHFVDYQEAAKIDARRLAEAVLRFQVSGSIREQAARNTLWSVESEIIIDADGRELVPRLKPACDANDRYNATRRAITKCVQPAEDKVVISPPVRADGRYGLLLEQQQSEAGKSNGTASVSLQVSHSSVRGVKTAHGDGFVVLGRCRKTGVQYLGLSDSSASLVKMAQSSLVPCDGVRQDSAAVFLTLVTAQLLLPALLENTDPALQSEGVVVHNAPAAVAALVSRHAKAAGVQIIWTTSSQEAAQQSPSLLVYLHQYLRQSELRTLLPANVSRCVDFTLEGRESTIASCLPANVHVVRAQSLLPSTVRGTKVGKEVETLLDVAVASALELVGQVNIDEGVREVDVGELELELDNPNPDPDPAPIVDAFTIINWTTSAKVNITVQPVSVHFKPDRTYWLVGLSGDLGASIADWMICNGARYLVMSSRNPVVDSVWLATAHRRGATVRVVACDLTDYDSLANAHAHMSSELPPIAGVYQGAMILHDRALRDLDLEGFTRAIRPKVDGSLNLDRLLADTPLDFFIFLSSVATVAGNPGQMAYTTANLFMTGLAQSRRRRGLPATVVELGLIMGIGYITREKGNQLTIPSWDRGLLTISETDVHQTLAEAISYGHPESAAAEWQLSIGLRRIPAKQPNRPHWYHYPQFACLTVRDAIEDTSADKGEAGVSVKTQLANAATKEDVEKIISESFITEMRKMLHLSDDYAITPLARTDELGLDSLVAVRIRSWFLNNYQINIPALRILKGAPLQELIDQAVNEIPGELVPKLASLVQSEDDKDSSSGLSGTQSLTADTPDTGVSSDDELVIVEEEIKEQPRALDLSRSGRLSHTQSVFLFVHELLSDKTTLNNTVMLHLSGKIRTPDLSRAVRQLGARHEALRSCIISGNDGLHAQGVLKSATLALETKRIRSKEDLTAEYAALRAHEFDLKSGHATRMILLSYSPVDHYLLMSSHHIFFDRLSNDAVMMDLERLYNGIPLEPNPLQYLDYSDEQARQYASGTWAEAIHFWKGQFITLPDPLPLHRSQIMERKPLARYASRIPEFRIDKHLTGKLRLVAREHRATPFHFHLAAFKILLHRFLSIDDICIGVADSCRADDHMRTGIGPFLNMLPLRMQAHGSETFAACLAATKEQSFDVLSHSIPLDVILNELRVSRGATHTPLAQAFMNYAENDLEDGQSFLGCRMNTVRQDMAELPYDITFTVLNNTTGDTRILLNVQESLYTESDALLLQHGYEDILREFSDAPNKEIGDDWVFREPVLQKALDLGRGPNFDSTWPESLIHRFETLFPTVAEQVAVTDGEGASLTYGELSQHVDTVAHKLLDENIQPGDRVGICQHATVWWIASLVAILKVGAVYVPLDVGTPVARLSLMVGDCQPAAVLVHGPTANMTEKLLENSPKTLTIDVSSLQNYLGGVHLVPVLAKPDAPAIILYTSGSTGTPKGVILRHSGLKHEFDHCAATYNLGTQDVVLTQSAWSFDVSVTQIFLALGVGARLHIVSHLLRADARSMAELVAKEGITATYATPTEYKSWLRRENQELVRSSRWRVALVAGEPVTEPLLQLFREVDRADLRLFNVYGPTETTCGSTKMELLYQTPAFYQDTIPVGRASANERFYILDGRQKLQPAGQAGEVVIGGVGVAIGYLNNDERTQASFLPDAFATQRDVERGWTTMYRTGDAGYLQHDGTLVLKGRIGDDTEVKLNGVRIDLKDIESTILQASSGTLADAVASVRSTADGMAKFMVVHVVFSSTENSSLEYKNHFIQCLLADLPLPRAMCPSAIIPIDDLPRTVAGKVDRRALSSLPITCQISPNIGQDGPQLSKSEITLRSLWDTIIPEELIGLHQIDAGSDFFGIGGTSLLLIELQSRIRVQLGVRIPLLSLFESSTLRSMARLLGVEGEDEIEESVAQIDWAAETALLPGLLGGPQESFFANPPARPPRTIVLTGVTGFLGQHLARTLVAQQDVELVICIAIRDLTPQRREALSYLGTKIACYEGDLRQPRLGLTEEAASRIFAAADVVIHNGADVSHLKTYASLRAANVGATAELARLCRTRMIPLHYISTTGVAMFLPRSEAALAEVSVRGYEPPSDGPGYIASKWVGEVYLEQAAHATGQPVWIHRPSSIMRPAAERMVGGGGEAADVVQNMLDYSLRMRAVPSVRGSGWVDLVRPESVTAGVVGALMSWDGAGEGEVVYVHESGDVELEVAEIQEYVCLETGEEVRELGLEEWISGAVEIGLSDAMAAVFRGALGGTEEVYLPRLLRS